MARPPLLAFFGHHKCASTWIHNIVDAVCADAGWKRAYLYGEHQFGGDLGAYVRRERLDWISYVNADARHLDVLPSFRGFHVVRDPRDLVVSAYFSHLHSHPTHAWPELVPHRERLSKLDKRDGLLAELEFSAQFLVQMDRWDYGRDDVLELRQEVFTKDPYRGFLDVFRFLGVLDEGHYNKARWPGYLARAALNITNRLSNGAQPLRTPFDAIPGERLLGIVWDNRFEKFSKGRDKGREDVKSHYRKGEGGDWVRHFEAVHVAAFKERWNDLVLRLGYESDPDWDLASTRAAPATAARGVR
jgi:hypothetical protein